MTPKAPDLAKALVSPMPLHLSVSVPSLFAWAVGMIVTWALLLLLAQLLRDTVMGRLLLFVVPVYLIQGLAFLLIMLIYTGTPSIVRVTMRNMLIGFAWGAAFDALIAIFWLCLIFRWQCADRETRSPLFRPTVIRKNMSSRPVVRLRPTRNTEPRYRITGNKPMRTRARKSLPKRTSRMS